MNLPCVTDSAATGGIRALVCASLLLLSSSQRAPAQEPRPSFEVASIKPNDPTRPGLGFHIGHGSYTVSDRLVGLIGAAFDLARQYIDGAPDWADRDQYDVVAKGDESADQARIKLMLQSLLADRRHLKFHRETRMVSGYSLTADPKKGMLAKEAHEPGLPMFVETNGLRARGTSMSQLCRFLSGPGLWTPVADNTGLTGIYEFRLFYNDPDNSTASSAPQYGSIFAALPRIGLKLASGKVPVTILHIDNLERPSQN